MKIGLNPHRHCSAGIWAALFVVVIVIVFIGLFISLLARCAKLPVRRLPDETNSLAASFTWNFTVPLLSQPLPLEQPDPAVSNSVFQSSVQFLWEDCMSNGVLVILRSFDWQEWTMLYSVLFGEQTFTNVVMVNPYGQVSTNLAANIEFLDMDAPRDGAFYRGLVITN